MARSPNTMSRRGRPPSLTVAARKTSKLQQNVRDLLTDLEDLEERLVRLETLISAGRKADRERAKLKASKNRSIRGRGPNVRDVAYQILARRKKPMGIQELSDKVLKAKKGVPGGNFTQNLGAALARDRRFARIGRGLYAIKK